MPGRAGRVVVRASVGGLAGGLAGRLLGPVPAPVGLGAAFVVGAVYVAVVLGWPFLDTGSDYWRLPSGILSPFVDVRTILSGYEWFVQDAWRWPVMAIGQVDAPVGSNAALMDCVPVLAIIGKLLRPVFGVVNLFPAWQVVCFGLNAAGLAALVRGLGQRSLLAGVLAGGMAAMSPLMHLRFGHFGLAAHWTFLFALAACVAGRGADRGGRLGVRGTSFGIAGLAALAMGCTPYLYPMVAAVGLAFHLGAVAERRLGLAAGGGGVVLLLLAGAVPAWAFGLLGRAEAVTQTFPFGYASMNLLAPFWPQTSGLLGWTGVYALTRGSIGATAGQYDAMCYVGGGVLLLLGVCLLRPRRAGAALWRGVRGRPFLVAALVALTVWAVSNRVYAGWVLVVSYPEPGGVVGAVLGWFRYGGRLFWPVVWMVCALGVAGALSGLRPGAAVLVGVVALGLQLVDLSVWRARVGAQVSGVPVSAFGSLAGSAEVEREVARLGRARVVPSLACTTPRSNEGVAASTGAAELQLMAARQNAAMDGVFKARDSTDCGVERATAITELVGRGVLLALAQNGGDRRGEAMGAYACRAVPVGLVCVPQ